MYITLRSNYAKLHSDPPVSYSSSTNSNATINDLPTEILLKVFTYLDHEHLLTAVSKVCERWETLHSDPSLYRRFTFTEFEPSTEVALKMLSIARWLKSLQLIDRQDTNEILQVVGSTNRLLETLVLQNCQGTPLTTSVSSDSLLGVLHQCNLLQQLSLKGTHSLSDEVYREIGLRLPKLRSVDFGPSTCFHSEVMLNITNNCRKVEEIRAFRFQKHTWDQITDNVVSSISNKFRDYLRIVKIDFRNCTDICLDSLSTCKKLTTLYLYNAHLITDFGIMKISDMPHIAKLTLTQADLVSANWWVVLFRKPLMKQLVKLNLLQCENVDDSVLRAIATESRDLRELRLEGNMKLTARELLFALLQLPLLCRFKFGKTI